MPLRTLRLGNTPVADLSAMRGMPLVEIKMRNSAVTDLSPLADSKTIEVISLPDNTFAEFWMEYDAKKR